MKSALFKVLTNSMMYQLRKRIILKYEVFGKDGEENRSGKNLYDKEKEE